MLHLPYSKNSTISHLKPNQSCTKISPTWNAYGYVMTMPREALQNLNFSRGTSLVNASAGLIFVSIFFNCNLPSSRAWWMKWILVSICFVWLSKVDFLAKWMALLLSKNKVKVDCLNPNSPKNNCNHRNSLSPLVRAMYSTSIEERATTSYLQEV